jgi:hypothetical protein
VDGSGEKYIRVYCGKNVISSSFFLVCFLFVFVLYANGFVFFSLFRIFLSDFFVVVVGK